MSALRWPGSTISCKVGGLVEGHGILGSSLPFESTRSCSSLSENEMPQCTAYALALTCGRH